ncbi:hypothetical protein BO79DRAFT_29320 [Aspergillus costaricaensis CBS 115574]|uniref:Uncharacterized protein n=1 Tax=Aspergillus costaricaensis CBS 115574 TaxID=1448317 RepID=A0ACD1IBL5_9EURO|nr:hypothetical protein BO79DRAFT_29320 [Aspergillus costaricaensis CBS 115574]RAK87681.1 hypothetical protein BO79DRAFT_29320 [Aspergillus costaricaensis CBS 115574]
MHSLFFYISLSCLFFLSLPKYVLLRLRPEDADDGSGTAVAKRPDKRLVCPPQTSKKGSSSKEGRITRRRHDHRLPVSREGSPSQRRVLVHDRCRSDNLLFLDTRRPHRRPRHPRMQPDDGFAVLDPGMWYIKKRGRCGKKELGCGSFSMLMS